MGIGVVLMGTSLDNGPAESRWSTLAGPVSPPLFVSPGRWSAANTPAAVPLSDDFRCLARHCSAFPFRIHCAARAIGSPETRRGSEENSRESRSRRNRDGAGASRGARATSMAQACFRKRTIVFSNESQASDPPSPSTEWNDSIECFRHHDPRVRRLFERGPCVLGINHT